MLEFEHTITRPSDKFYYNRFPYKVVVHGNTWNHNAVRHGELRDFLRNQDEWWDMQSVQRDKLSLYIRNESTIEELEHFFRDIIVEILCPYNDAVLEEMKLGRDDVRESLYYNKYRYRIELGQQWRRTSNFDKMESVIISLQRDDTRLHSSKSGFTHILYTNAKHDLVKLKLTSDKNTKIDYKECKLYTEI